MAFKELDISEQLIWLYKRLTGVSSNVVTLTSSVNLSGEIKMFGGATAPTGWAVCDGASLLVASYPGLFAALGYTYGGAGANFSLPDMRGRTAIGAGTGVGLTARTLGDAVGAEDHVLLEAELPIHNHDATGLTVATSLDGMGTITSLLANGNYLGDSTAANYRENAVGGLGALHTDTMQGNTASTGSDTAHENMQPSLALNYIIAL
tara:strand:+ start:851 stop:1471 length:621 start_codon:yes stop_codon:yes gene_type:complete